MLPSSSSEVIPPPKCTCTQVPSLSTQPAIAANPEGNWSCNCAAIACIYSGDPYLSSIAPAQNTPTSDLPADQHLSCGKYIEIFHSLDVSSCVGVHTNDHSPYVSLTQENKNMYMLHYTISSLCHYLQLPFKHYDAFCIVSI